MIPLPFIIGGMIGGLLVGRSKPKTPSKRYQCFGPVSGHVYIVDDFTKAGIIVVNAPDGARTSVTLRKVRGGHQYVAHRGSLDSARVVLSDFTKPKLVKQ